MVEYKLNSEKKKKVVTEEVDNILSTSFTGKEERRHGTRRKNDI